MATTLSRDELYNRAKRMYVEDGLGYHDIARALNNARAPSTFCKWGKKPDADGRTWDDLRLLHRDARYAAASPAEAVNTIIGLLGDIQRIRDEAIEDGKLDTQMAMKLADPIAKLTASLDKVGGIKHQVPTMYHMLEQFIRFVRMHYAELHNKALLDAILDFKNHLRRELAGS